MMIICWKYLQGMGFHLIITVFHFCTPRHRFSTLEKKSLNFDFYSKSCKLLTFFHFFSPNRRIFKNHYYSLSELIKMIFLHTQFAFIPNLDKKIHFVEKKVSKKCFFMIFVKEAFRATVQKCAFACKFKQKTIFFPKIKIDV